MFCNSAASLSNLSVTTSTQADAPTQNGSEDSEGSQNLEEPEEDSRGDGGAGDGEVEASQVRFDRERCTLPTICGHLGTNSTFCSRLVCTLVCV